MKRLKNALLLVIFINLSLSVLAQMPSKTGRGEGNSAGQRDFTPFRPKRSKEQEQQLLPNFADTDKYANFLKQPGTGLIRLYPDLECETHYVLRVDEGCANNIPGASNYSFREQEYTNSFLADIRLKTRFFIADGFLTQAFIVNLGNIPLENISLGSNGMKYLTEFEPATENNEALKQYQQFSKGFKVDKYEYRKIAVAAENTTYALRTVAYQATVYKDYQGWKYNVLEGDKRVDMIVIFRVVRKDKDGSMTLLWKELEHKKSVKIKLSKKPSSE